MKFFTERKLNRLVLDRANALAEELARNAVAEAERDQLTIGRRLAELRQDLERAQADVSRSGQESRLARERIVQIEDRSTELHIRAIVQIDRLKEQAERERRRADEAEAILERHRDKIEAACDPDTGAPIGEAALHKKRADDLAERLHELTLANQSRTCPSCRARGGEAA